MRLKQIFLIGLIAVIVVIAVYVAMALAGQEYGSESEGPVSQWCQEYGPDRYGIETAGLDPKLQNAMA